MVYNWCFLQAIFKQSSNENKYKIFFVLNIRVQVEVCQAIRSTKWILITWFSVSLCIMKLIWKEGTVSHLRNYAHTHTILLPVLSCHSFLSWEQNITSWLYSPNNIPLLSLVIYIAFSHKGQFYEIHLTVVKRDGGYNNLINVLESMLIQMEESFLLLNTAAVWLQAALASVG